MLAFADRKNVIKTNISTSIDANVDAAQLNVKQENHSIRKGANVFACLKTARTSSTWPMARMVNHKGMQVNRQPSGTKINANVSALLKIAPPTNTGNKRCVLA